MHVRTVCVEHMRSHAAEFSCFCAGEGEFDAYLKKMGRARAWGDELTLRAICNAFGATLHVTTSQEGSWYLKYEPEERKAGRSVFLAYVSPVHYNAFALASSGGDGERGAESAAPRDGDGPALTRSQSRRSWSGAKAIIEGAKRFATGWGSS